MKELPEDSRPREKLLLNGASSLSDSELLAIILRNGSKDKNAIQLAIDVLKKFPLTAIRDCSYYDLLSIYGIGSVKAIDILAAIEFGKRIFLKNVEKKRMFLSNPKDIWLDAKYYIVDLKQEYFYCYYFNNRQELLERKLLFMGTINRSVVHPREIFKEAYRLSASSIICVHNHPSGSIQPSKEDILLTDHLVKIGQLQGILVRDHIIVCEDSYYSFFEHRNILNL